MKFLTRITLLCLVFSLPVLPGPQKFSKVDQKIMFHLFNAEWQISDSLINQQIEKQPEHPKYYMFKCPMYFYMRYFSNQPFARDSMLQLIADNAQKAIELGEKLPESTETMFIVGTAYGYLSRSLIMRGEFWDGYWAARDARNILEDVLDEDPGFYDAYMGLGVIEYYPAVQVTGFRAFLAWLVGMSGDRELGLEYFHKVAENGELFKGEATYALMMLYRFFENDYANALAYNNQLVDVYTNNNAFPNQQLQLQLLIHIQNEGVQILETNLDTIRVKYNITNQGILNALGYNYMYEQNDLDNALAVFRANIKLFPDQANPYDSIAECYQNRGENDMAIKYARLTLQKIEQDSTINDQFRENLRTINQDRLNELGADVNI